MSQKIIHDITWNQSILERFINSANLSDEEELFMRLRVSDVIKSSIPSNLGIEESTCQLIGISSSTYYRWLEQLKNKYDKLSNLRPDLFPARSTYKSLLNDFDGVAYIDGQKIDFRGNEFKDIVEARNYFVKNAENLLGEKFAKLGKKFVDIRTGFWLDIKQKK